MTNKKLVMKCGKCSNVFPTKNFNIQLCCDLKINLCYSCIYKNNKLLYYQLNDIQLRCLKCVDCYEYGKEKCVNCDLEFEHLTN